MWIMEDLEVLSDEFDIPSLITVVIKKNMAG
jgi:hypothetical protein